MKKFKKYFALLLSFVMIMGMAVTAYAATSESTTEDSSVFHLETSVSGASVSYKAITVDGGTDSEGATWDSSTTYSYYISLPSGSSVDGVPVSVTFESDSKLLIDGEEVSDTGAYSANIDFSETHTFELTDFDDGEIRSFQVTAGVIGETIAPVYVRVDVKNAVDWLKTNTKADTTAAVNAVTTAITNHGYTVNADGQMATFVQVNGLSTGATAMDALQAACTELGLVTRGSSYYISGIGDGTTFLSERATTGYSGWLYLDKPAGKASFSMANYGASAYKLNGGEQFVWCFANGWDTDQYSYLNQ